MNEHDQNHVKIGMLNVIVHSPPSPFPEFPPWSTVQRPRNIWGWDQPWSNIFGMSQLQFWHPDDGLCDGQAASTGDEEIGDVVTSKEIRKKKRAAISDYIQWIGLRENLQEPPIFHRKKHIVYCRCSLKPIQWRRSVSLFLDGCSFHDVRRFHQIGPNPIVELPWLDGEPMRPKRPTISTGRTGMVEIYIYLYQKYQMIWYSHLFFASMNIW